jgi:hypothetical protein
MRHVQEFVEAVKHVVTSAIEETRQALVAESEVNSAKAA